MSANGLVSVRGKLAELLTEAAELEHGVLCQYLFAAFSMKRATEESVSWQQLELMRQWRTSIMLVARQEMEHLGYVCNMLTAIGEAPYLSRPNFPLGSRRYPMKVPFRLERFGHDALKRFILFEIPQQLTSAEQQELERALPGVVVKEHQTIGQLYEEVSDLFGAGGPELFVGPRSAQIEDVQIRGLRGVGAGGPIYDLRIEPVTDVETAQAAVKQIIEEGEGTSTSKETSHFLRFCRIAEELTKAQADDPSFEPARAVVSDPDRARAVTAPAAVALCDLFDLAYGTMLLMLIRWFAKADESETQLAGMQHVMFFPMMTMVIRPLGELITLLPAANASTERAGARFTSSRGLSPLPHRHAAWKVIGSQLVVLGERASELALAGDYPPDVQTEVQTRLTLMGENLKRLARDFEAAMEAAR
jgi:Ferritin-like